MALSLGKAKSGEGMMSLFPHSREYSQGVGTKQERTGAGIIVVAQDGTGDFENFREALNSMADGGEIFIKEGTYILSDTYDLSYLFPSNTTIRGSGANTILKTDAAGSYWFSFLNKSNILIENLTFWLYTTAGTEAPFDLDGASNITFRDCTFTFGNENMDAIFWDSLGNTCNAFTLDHCTSNNSGSNAVAVFALDMANYCTIINNNFWQLQAFLLGTGSYMENVVFIGNTFERINTTGNTSETCRYFGNCIGNGNTITITAGNNRGAYIGNMVDIAISDTGTANQVANNVVY